MKNKYRIVDDKVFITLERRSKPNVETVISLSSFESLKLLNHKWRVSETNKKLYVSTNIKKGDKTTTLKLHRYVTDCPQGFVVDHINGNTLDNTLENLRVCLQAENMQNRPFLNRNNTSGERGVTYCKRLRKWIAAIMLNRKRIHIGTYENKVDAIEAVREARTKYFTHVS